MGEWEMGNGAMGNGANEKWGNGIGKIAASLFGVQFKRIQNQLNPEKQKKNTGRGAAISHYLHALGRLMSISLDIAQTKDGLKAIPLPRLLDLRRPKPCK